MEQFQIALDQVLKILATSPVVTVLVQMVKKFFNPSPKVTPYFAVGIGVIAGIIWAASAEMDPMWLKWVVGVFAGALSGLTSMGIWETTKVASRHELDKAVKMGMKLPPMK